ncbi:MAG TPA: hypothetical protein VFE38_05515 [Edaphobacter sp.]|nr:hypothetical protein [Edaphobacter sp.]
MMQFNRRNFIAGAFGTGALSVVSSKAIAEKDNHQQQSVLSPDWLLDSSSYKAKISRQNDDKEIVLSNGLLRRVFRLAPNATTIAFDNLTTDESVLRSIRPEATLTIDDYALAVGGLHGQPVQNYFLPEFLDHMTANARDFHFLRVEEGTPRERFPWKRVPEWSTEELPWPAPGVSLTFHYGPGAESPIKDVQVRVRYELYDGIPLLAKQVELENNGNAPIILNSFQAEILAIAESGIGKLAPNAFNNLLDKVLPIHVETDYDFGGYMDAAQDNPAVQWKSDPLYGSNYYDHSYPCLLECTPPVGPELEIAPGQTWSSFTVFELLHDSSDAERRGLAMRKMMTLLAPWVQENPIYMHARYAEPEKVKYIIDQCAEVGFEMVILSFGSGFNIENTSIDYLNQMKELADYARKKGIAIGGYSLLASRGGKRQDLVIDVKTDRPGGGKFGPSPCLGSQWAEGYFKTLRAFFPYTGMSVFENDGSYPGDFCASTTHPGHKGYLDSQWRQWQVMSEFYRWCRGQGIYLTVPDWYFLNGQSKTGMGYTENDWSLPREYQPLIERQDIYDGTWEKTPSMGWMHVPLMQYHGGGSAATVEPLHQNLAHYETRLADLLGAGVQAAWRGDRLYDTDETRDAVRKWVRFYKQNRAILDSDIIHLRRPDGRDWDGILHVNPRLKTRGLAMLYNPLNETIMRTIKIPLYYTGLTKIAKIQIQNESAQSYSLDRDYSVAVTIQIPANGRTWFAVS